MSDEVRRMSIWGSPAISPGTVIQDVSVGRAPSLLNSALSSARY